MVLRNVGGGGAGVDAVAAARGSKQGHCDGQSGTCQLAGARAETREGRREKRGGLCTFFFLLFFFL